MVIFMGYVSFREGKNVCVILLPFSIPEILKTPWEIGQKMVMFFEKQLLLFKIWKQLS